MTGVRIDNITDLEGGGKDDLAPAPHNEFDLGSTWDPATRTYTANIGVAAGRQRVRAGDLQLYAGSRPRACWRRGRRSARRRSPS